VERPNRKSRSSAPAALFFRWRVERLIPEWSPEVEALKLVAAEQAHRFGLRQGLDALGCRRDPEAAGKRKDCVDDGKALALALRRCADEALVDLDLRKSARG
jgi:hypothetical protein